MSEFLTTKQAVMVVQGLGFQCSEVRIRHMTRARSALFPQRARAGVIKHYQERRALTQKPRG